MPYAQYNNYRQVLLVGVNENDTISSGHSAVVFHPLFRIIVGAGEPVPTVAKGTPP